MRRSGPGGPSGRFWRRLDCSCSDEQLINRQSPEKKRGFLALAIYEKKINENRKQVHHKDLTDVDAVKNERTNRKRVQHKELRKKSNSRSNG